MVQLKVGQVDMDDVLGDLIRVHQSHRPNAKAGQVVVVRCNGKTIRAVARGAKGNVTGEIRMDADYRDRLGVKDGETKEFRITKAGWVDEWLWLWGGSNASGRVAARISIISFFLGIVGLVLGILPLFTR